MTEASFRIIVSVAVALAALAFVVQSGLMIALYRCSKNMQHLSAKFTSDMKPILARIGTVFTTADRIMEDARPQIQEITRDTAAIAKSGLAQTERLSCLLRDASMRVRALLAQVDRMVERLEHAMDTVERGVTRPIREVNGLAAGVSAAVSTLAHGLRRSDDLSH